MITEKKEELTGKEVIEQVVAFLQTTEKLKEEIQKNGNIDITLKFAIIEYLASLKFLMNVVMVKILREYNYFLSK